MKGSWIQGASSCALWAWTCVCFGASHLEGAPYAEGRSCLADTELELHELDKFMYNPSSRFYGMVQSTGPASAAYLMGIARGEVDVSDELASSIATQEDRLNNGGNAANGS